MTRLHFAHSTTRVLVSGDAEHPCTGQTLWIGESEDGAEAGVAWDWICMPEGVVALADPMALVTNLQFVSTAGEVLAPMESVLQLNEIVRTLPWQDEVQRALGLLH
ncbi:hypothetical protein G8A07_00600 [Roseateles sp. DAIF2]|uniref:hypothetical protein n=1 Tax=Roseateles sp. DAIF2 TaxID=2714952 RepID=UPI0018A2F38E|nr:hypothetical protein [Roseateles sp. DAIF2]QPF71566.1 hypothetical protein G8A07_00600 [Roseateles sp. DAIF2]